jgi:hypothetical protein
MTIYREDGGDLPVLEPLATDALLPSQEELLRARLLPHLHRSYCWKTGTPTSDGYVVTLYSHPEGHGDCEQALETIQTYLLACVDILDDAT